MSISDIREHSMDAKIAQNDAHHPLWLMQLTIPDGRQDLSHLVRDLHAFFPMAIFGTIPV